MQDPAQPREKRGLGRQFKETFIQLLIFEFNKLLWPRAKIESVTSAETRGRKRGLGRQFKETFIRLLIFAFNKLLRKDVM